MNLLKIHPNASRLVRFVVLTLIALFLVDYLPLPSGTKEVFPFVGLILVVLANWILYKTENKNLDELGFNLKGHNLKYLPIGLVLGVLAVLLGYYLKCFLTGDNIILHQNINYLDLLKQLYWILPTAAVQEFICRSYGYKKLISIYNLRIANLVAVIVFVAMHNIFNIGLFGALFYSISIVIGHFVFANALLKSGTIFFAIGIHWGSNLANNQLFTEEKLSTSILFLEKAVVEEPTGFNPLGILLFIITLNMDFSS
ncbi:CPBP family intramembrane metalloprotease [Maribacter sp. PR1]|uniref:CPBP family intramembrane glutamic endopeptidase n=1 Tax=Maribacter cobaltidurans TaxID=1178778 RepID=A0ABU7IUW0_9FLAO|nr:MULTISPECIES: CPBP family intramembrane glutamic endopeptidase [Maribacter]MDC6389379.1 CPBP family intramembrane metalloprotease [Maribacter sp. PR1]MEE1976767.1 CPBP family intramembrane glutamic endopeptidase [Maribacter cobaltidurans]